MVSESLTNLEFSKLENELAGLHDEQVMRMIALLREVEGALEISRSTMMLDSLRSGDLKEPYATTRNSLRKCLSSLSEFVSKVSKPSQGYGVVSARGVDVSSNCASTKSTLAAIDALPTARKEFSTIDIVAPSGLTELLIYRRALEPIRDKLRTLASELEKDHWQVGIGAHIKNVSAQLEQDEELHRNLKDQANHVYSDPKNRGKSGKFLEEQFSQVKSKLDEAYRRTLSGKGTLSHLSQVQVLIGEYVSESRDGIVKVEKCLDEALKAEARYTFLIQSTPAVKRKVNSLQQESFEHLKRLEIDANAHDALESVLHLLHDMLELVDRDPVAMETWMATVQGINLALESKDAE